ncbi:hypothetical protein MVEN_00040700 [Mycena venus]|uniref:Uncharacterized protein n=1 Tax=Mycena venus TaxID=2733690 RepID=A0A8H6Z759_9AGAR|nr:hypothetical protein MVEN_00040700 [Mycena venus]
MSHTRDKLISENALSLLTSYLFSVARNLVSSDSLLHLICYLGALAMPKLNKRQVLGKKVGSLRGGGDENEAPDPVLPFADIASQPPKPPPRSLRSEITEKGIIIVQLEARISVLETELSHLRNTHHKSVETLSRDNRCLLDRNQLLSATNKSLTSRKRKAERELSEEIARKQKRIRRLERDRESKADVSNASVQDIQDRLDTALTEIGRLNRDLAQAHIQICSRDHCILSIQSSLRNKQSTLTAVRNRFYAAQKQIQRAQTSLKGLKKEYKELRTWEPTEGGQYTAVARELARNLTYAGCAAGKVEFAVRSCADAFGIKIRRRFMSRRTVARAIDEGGKYGEIQLGREIMDSPGFIESSDGTTHRGITIESRHITMLVPSYALGVDDSDRSTWTHHTRFMEVAPALDHTAQRQFEGTMEAAARIADAYTRSPLAAQENRAMETDDYYRKKLGECKDHAADGKKEFAISAEHKTDIVIRDLGRAAMDDDDLRTSQILTTMLDITDDDLEAEGKLSHEELLALPAEERRKLTSHVLERKIGEDKFHALTPEEQEACCMHLFGGCCCHKDLNVLRIAYAGVQRLYSIHPTLTPPVLLANKANSATIRLGADDPKSSAAVENAIEASSSGAIKLLQLLGALLRHKDGERGYQDKCTIFMRQRQLEQYGIKNAPKFPDVSNTRYSSFTYGAAYVVCFHGLIQELITEIIDGKTHSGQPNHVEHLILKGINCPETMSHMVAIALYGVSVGWGYMAMVRGPAGEPVNLLSLTALHRRLPEFCAIIAAFPWKILDPTTPLTELTIDGQPFRDHLLITSIDQLRPTLPNLFLIVSTLFSSAEEGWIRFTPEFRIGGTFDRLTPAQRANMWIPATNDRNEGMLGTGRNWFKYKPNSTAQSFSNHTRTQQNNTEAFIKKYCDKAVEKFVMREVRRDGASGRRAEFRRLWVALQKEKAERGLKRREAAAAKKKSKASRLAATALELDITKIQAMTSKLLKDQLAVYRDVLKDDILGKKLWKDMSTVAVRRELVLQARERELARQAVRDSQDSNNPETTPETIIIDEYGYSAGDDDEWEEIVE